MICIYCVYMYNVDFLVLFCCCPIGPLHDPVTWYGINHTGTQITQWDFQNKGNSGWTGVSSFVLEVPLRNLRPSVIIPYHVTGSCKGPISSVW